MFAISRSTSMKLYGAIGLIFLATQVYAEEHSHESGGQNGGSTMNHGKKWEGDEVLRQGMDNIRQVMTTNQDAIKNGRLDSQDYKRLAEAVGKSVNHIVKNCKLTKEVNSAFHNIVLVDLLYTAELMRLSPTTQARRAGAFGVLQSLRNYGKYFQHPGWRMSEETSR